jgi:hypothetical protein
MDPTRLDAENRAKNDEKSFAIKRDRGFRHTNARSGILFQAYMRRQ